MERAQFERLAMGQLDAVFRLAFHLTRKHEEADITRLRAAGWHPPEPFSVEALDRNTDLYGAIFRPSNFEPKRRKDSRSSSEIAPAALSIA